MDDDSVIAPSLLIPLGADLGVRTARTGRLNPSFPPPETPRQAAALAPTAVVDAGTEPDAMRRSNPNGGETGAGSTGPFLRAMQFNDFRKFQFAMQSSESGFQNEFANSAVVGDCADFSMN